MRVPVQAAGARWFFIPPLSMAFAVKKAINKQLRDVGVQAFDTAAVTLLADFVQEQGGDAALSEFCNKWKSGASPA
jgi:hypothetical protein